MGRVRKYLVLAAAFALMAAAVALAYQAAARDRDYRALLARGDTAVRTEDTFAAIEAYSGAIALRPDSMLPYLRRGEAYQRRGELDQAARDFRAAGALDPTATRPIEALGDAFYAMRRFDRAADSYSRYLQLDDRAAPVNYKLALARYQTGDVDAALETLAATLRIDASVSDAHYLQGLCFRDKQKILEAEAAFERAIALTPAHVPAREELADLYRAQNRRREELEQLRLIAELDRDQIERQVALGVAQARAGQDEAALKTLGAVLESTPSPSAYRALGQIWLAQAQAHGERVYVVKALEALGRIASNPDATSEVLTLYGRALLMDEQLEPAELALQQASTRYPLDPASLLLYASVAERQGHLDAARQALIDHASLVADAPDAVPQALRVADLSLRLNDPDTAGLWFGRALRLAPEETRILEQLADAQLRAGDPLARETIARGLERDPGNRTLLALAKRAQ
jgi:tetratricopeptide (TPR) repeat protein